MREYTAARIEAEESIRAAGLDVNATFLRLWYLLGPKRGRCCAARTSLPFPPV
jgi:hypothetical protein